MKVHCLFEQSGTFKNEFKKLGYEAYDYDILNNFGETDYVIDLFAEIRGGYEGKPSIFDEMGEDDLILAFFPCIRFESLIILGFTGNQYQQRDWSLKKKMEYDLELMEELKNNYDLVNKLFITCINKGLKLVMENPYCNDHFLKRYWCLPPAIIDKDRREMGDYFAKPTQYWFLNFEPRDNLIFEPITYNHIAGGRGIKHMVKEDALKTGAQSVKEARSMIHPDYANRFIRRHLIDL